MERKIGEIFEYNGEWYQCVGGICRNCSFYYYTVCKNITTIGSTTIGNCHCSLRTDHKSVIFKKLEKVGEPFPCRNMSSGRYSIIAQWYKVFVDPILTDDSALSWYNSINETILIALNNKEDMKEGNNTKHSNSESIGKNLKTFDLQAAKSGKPVCTRDGRKARIICFDRVTNSTNEYTGSLVVLITNPNGDEQSWYYTDKGILAGRDEYDNHKYDLMMLPEKKEGWVNIYKDPVGKVVSTQIVFSSEETAKQNINSNRIYISTVKIEWYE